MFQSSLRAFEKLGAVRCPSLPNKMMVTLDWREGVSFHKGFSLQQELHAKALPFCTLGEKQLDEHRSASCASINAGSPVPRPSVSLPEFGVGDGSFPDSASL